jgi:hypothetical protein
VSTRSTHPLMPLLRRNYRHAPPPHRPLPSPTAASFSKEVCELLQKSDVTGDYITSRPVTLVCLLCDFKAAKKPKPAAEPAAAATDAGAAAAGAAAGAAVKKKSKFSTMKETALEEPAEPPVEPAPKPARKSKFTALKETALDDPPAADSDAESPPPPEAVAEVKKAKKAMDVAAKQVGTTRTCGYISCMHTSSPTHAHATCLSPGRGGRDDAGGGDQAGGGGEDGHGEIGGGRSVEAGIVLCRFGCVVHRPCSITTPPDHYSLHPQETPAY